MKLCLIQMASLTLGQGCHCWVSIWNTNWIYFEQKRQDSRGLRNHLSSVLYLLGSIVAVNSSES